MQLLEEQVANDKAKKMYSSMVSPMPEPEIVSCTSQENYNRIQGLRSRMNNLSHIVENVDERARDNLKRIDDLNHKLCNTQRRLDSVQSQLQTHQRFVADMCGIAAIFMVLICILVGYLLWRTA